MSKCNHNSLKYCDLVAIGTRGPAHAYICIHCSKEVKFDSIAVDKHIYFPGKVIDTHIYRRELTKFGEKLRIIDGQV